MSFEELHDKELSSIRKWCSERGSFSWTSPQYQSDILNFVYDNRDKGSCVVEVGCYKGGLTALLAFVCKQAGLSLYSMDISKESVETSLGVLNGLGLGGNASVEVSTLTEFVPRNKITRAPVLCILDGDHAYDAVLFDIRACSKIHPKPYAIAFHDYSLRHPTTDERVSDAIDDYFGASTPRKLIGQPMNGTGHATKETPQPDGHWWHVPGSE